MRNNLPCIGAKSCNLPSSHMKTWEWKEGWDALGFENYCRTSKIPFSPTDLVVLDKFSMYLPCPYISVVNLAKKCGISRRTACRSILWLECQGLIYPVAKVMPRGTILYLFTDLRAFGMGGYVMDRAFLFSRFMECQGVNRMKNNYTAKCHEFLGDLFEIDEFIMQSRIQWDGKWDFKNAKSEELSDQCGVMIRKLDPERKLIRRLCEIESHPTFAGSLSVSSTTHKVASNDTPLSVSSTTHKEKRDDNPLSVSSTTHKENDPESAANDTPPVSSTTHPLCRQ